MTDAPRVHDLVRVDVAALPTADVPTWVWPSLRRAPWLVVRRVTAPPGQLAVGARGERRDQRHGWLVPEEVVWSRRTPEQLRPGREDAGHPNPARAALARLAPVLDELVGRAWGPVGAVGFELASGSPVTTATSDLDLIVRAPTVPGPVQVAALAAATSGADVAVDCLLELPDGAVALTELVTGRPRFVLRTAFGPRLAGRR